MLLDKSDKGVRIAAAVGRVVASVLVAWKLPSLLKVCSYSQFC